MFNIYRCFGSYLKIIIKEKIPFIDVVAKLLSRQRNVTKKLPEVQRVVPGQSTEFQGVILQKRLAKQYIFF